LIEATDVAVIGAGPAGLAVGACLRKAGLNSIILEKNHQVGSSWHRHYERLHLHTIKQLSALPYVPFPKHYPRYVPRRLMIEYLDLYAARFELRPRFGESVHSVRRNDEDWLVETVSSSVKAAHVVIASGLNDEPVIPALPGLEKFKGKVIHSADYINFKSFAGQTVLVIGMGNTGAEIALDLCEGGARPTLSLRGNVHITPRDLFGVPIQVVATVATKMLPISANDALFPFILDWALGDLSKHGITRPKQGILRQVVDLGKIPVLDVGTVRQIFADAIKIAPGISMIDEDEVVFADGKRNRFDAMILATGYRPNYRSFLLEADDVNARNDDMRGKKTQTIHFVGFHSPVTGLLREISKEAIRTVGAIVRSQSEAMPRPN
jgi:indole-3-pyruvate monooxygenase